MTTFICINLIYFNIKHFNTCSSTNNMNISILKLIYIHRDLLHVLAKNIHHLQEGKIQRMSTSKMIITLLILCILPPWRWPCVYPKPKENVVHCVYKLISKYLCAFCRYHYYIFSVQFLFIFHASNSITVRIRIWNLSYRFTYIKTLKKIYKKYMCVCVCVCVCV